MSRQSKAKRDARKKHERRPLVRRAGPRFEAHAQLLDDAGELVAAGGRAGDDWVVIVAGQALDGIDSAALLIAMLRHIAARCSAEGRPTALTLSPVLEQAAADEAAAGGHTLDQWLALLEAERLEHTEKRRATAH